MNRGWIKVVNPDYMDPPRQWHVRIEPEQLAPFHFYGPTKFSALRKACRYMQEITAAIVTAKLTS